jgi:hypothetical protein
MEYKKAAFSGDTVKHTTTAFDRWYSDGMVLQIKSVSPAAKTQESPIIPFSDNEGG